ncbi:MAG: archaellin/type IV pilin N-terminal domain-containing protein [Candidatus Bathyarchaeia archaeon]
MKNLKQSRKALSPVVASIILIAVTVAVSIAVAAWMGALTTGFMGSSSITITDAQFDKSGTGITLHLKNTGTKTVTIATVRINGEPKNNFDLYVGTDLAAPKILPSGTSGRIEMVEEGWNAGYVYKFDIYDNSGQLIGSYQATPPA